MNKKLIILLMFFLTACNISNENIINNRIIIKSIGIDNIITLSSINEDVNGIVMFSEYGRPNLEKTNTVIGAHSGTGENAYFNNLKDIEIGDIITLIYEEISYEYLVINLMNVNKEDVYVLDDKDYTSLTIMTCDLSNLEKRIIVVAKLCT